MDWLKVLVRLGLRVVGAVEEVGVLRSVWLGPGQVHRCESEALGQSEDRLVAAVDQLAAELGALGIRPVAGKLGEVGVHPAADASRVRLVDGRRDSSVLQGQRGGKPGDASAHDRDALPGRGARRVREQAGSGECYRGARGAGPLEKLAA